MPNLMTEILVVSQNFWYNTLIWREPRLWYIHCFDLRLGEKKNQRFILFYFALFFFFMATRMKQKPSFKLYIQDFYIVF